MDSLPLSRALLGELLLIDGQDIQLPLELTVSIYREQLRLPLRRLAHLSETSTRKEVLSTLAWRYPLLRNGACFEHSSAERLLRQIKGGFIAVLDNYANAETVGTEIMELLLIATDDWQIYEPLTLLYNLSLGTEMARQWLPIFEAALATSPQVGDMILDMSWDDFEERVCFEVSVSR